MAPPQRGHTAAIATIATSSHHAGGHHQQQQQYYTQQQQRSGAQAKKHHNFVALPLANSSSNSQRETASKRPDTTVSISTMYTQGYRPISSIPSMQTATPKQMSVVDQRRATIVPINQPPPEEDVVDKSSTCGTILIFISVALVILTLPFSLFVCFKVVQEYERAVIFRLGRLMQGGAKGPGIFFVLPCIDSYARVDLRTRTYDVPPQEVLTKDSVTVSVDAVVYYRVSNATVSIANVENAHHSTRLLAQTTLRNTMGTRHLHEILSERVSISGSMQMQLDEATDAWGIKVERVEIKDVRLPVSLQRAMAAEAEAAREARAKVIAAEGEQKASKALREASEVIGGSPAALQLRYLQTLSTISAEKNSTIVFPLPIDLITYFLKTNDESTQRKAAKAAAAMAHSAVEAIANQQQQQIQQQQQEQLQLQQQQQLQLQQQQQQQQQHQQQHQQQSTAM